MFVNPGGPGGSVEQVRDERSGPGRCRSGPVRRGRLGHPRRRRQHPCALLSQRAEPGDGSSATGRSPRRPLSHVATCPRRSPRAALRRGQRRAAGPHLHRRHGPRPRLSAPAGRRPPAHVPRPLRRHVHRPDLRQHVPAPRAGDGPGRRGRPGRLHEGYEAGYANQPDTDLVFEVPVAVPERRARRAAHLAGKGPVGAAGRCAARRICGRRPSRPRPPTRPAS